MSEAVLNFCAVFPSADKYVVTILFCYRKHTLNCHRMKPALFSVLCEIKEKTGKSAILINDLAQGTCTERSCTQISAATAVDNAFFGLDSTFL